MDWQKSYGRSIWNLSCISIISLWNILGSKPSNPPEYTRIFGIWSMTLPFPSTISHLFLKWMDGLSFWMNLSNIAGKILESMIVICYKRNICKNHIKKEINITLNHSIKTLILSSKWKSTLNYISINRLISVLFLNLNSIWMSWVIKLLHFLIHQEHS